MKLCLLCFIVCFEALTAQTVSITNNSQTRNRWILFDYVSNYIRVIWNSLVRGGKYSIGDFTVELEIL